MLLKENIVLSRVFNGSEIWDMMKGVSFEIWVGISGVWMSLHLMFVKLMGRRVVSSVR